MTIRDTEMFSSRYGANTSGATRQVQDAVSLTSDHVLARQHSTYAICLLCLNGCLSLKRDNLEFLQWIKKFWDQNFGGQPYDAIARRKGVALDTPATIAPVPRHSAHGVSASRTATRTPSGGTLAPSAF